jgi:alpha/beta hydrolase fold
MAEVTQQAGGRRRRRRSQSQSPTRPEPIVRREMLGVEHRARSWTANHIQVGERQGPTVIPGPPYDPRSHRRRYRVRRSERTLHPPRRASGIAKRQPEGKCRSQLVVLAPGYPWLDLRPNSANGSADLEMWYVAQYLGDHAPSQYSSPALAPDLSGLPSALILAAGRDPLRDEAVRYARQLDLVGVDAKLVEYVEAPHAFLQFPAALSLARHAFDDIAADLDAAFGEPAPGASRPVEVPVLERVPVDEDED